MQPLPSSNFPDPNGRSEKALRRFETRHFLHENAVQHVHLDHLLEQGFSWEEAITLVHMREHLYENTEMRQRIEHDAHMLFVRWMIEHGELSEG